MTFDVVIVGGGPAGSTCAGFLKKYAPSLKVLVVERETFPRDHVGESQIPPVSRVLAELGAWDKIEGAGFPIKLGVTYKWGRSNDLWDFNFYPADMFRDEPRPAKFAGQRMWTAFQVDRSVYDTILLNHAAELGAEVLQGARVVKVEREGDRVAGVVLEDGKRLEANWFVDATGHAGLLRRTMDVSSDPVTSLQNIAIWDYWQNAEWAVDIGVGGTRSQIVSVGYGWIWFIPLGPTRTSIGLVVPKSKYKELGTPASELYHRALGESALISKLLATATCEDKLQTTKDWSFVAGRQHGENWFLVGEAGGFADPILSAGLALSQQAAKELALTLIELEKGRFSPQWLRDEYERRQSDRLRNHIRFADYWYSANSCFTDLQEFTSVIAKENGLVLEPQKAWAWLSQGGFIDSDGFIGVAGFGVDHLRSFTDFLAEVEPTSVTKTCNVYELDLEGAEWRPRAHYGAGVIEEWGAYARGDRMLPLSGVFDVVVKMLSKSPTLPGLIEQIKAAVAARPGDQGFVNEVIGTIPHAIEAMAADGWIKPRYDPSLGMRNLPERVGKTFAFNVDNKYRDE